MSFFYHDFTKGTQNWIIEVNRPIAQLVEAAVRRTKASVLKEVFSTNQLHSHRESPGSSPGRSTTHLEE